MWHKVQAGLVTASRSTLPESEQLSDGSWVTGFPGADAGVIAAAGWVQSNDLGPQPDDGHTQTAVWTLNGDGTVTGAWVQGDPLPPPERTPEQQIADARAVLADGAAELEQLPAPATPADVTATVADILARAAAALNGGA